MNNIKIHKVKVVSIVLLFFCFLACFMCGPILNQSFVEANAATYTDDLIVNNWEYLSNLEKEYREDNPNITPTQMGSFLENKILELKQAEESNIMLLNDDSTVGDSSYSIFGKTVTSAEITLVAAYPAQALIAYNASQEAENIVPNFYSGRPWLNNGDALRHAYWNALMERRISKDVLINTGTPDFPVYTTIQVDFAKEFADAHEYGQTGIDTEMDLRNNELGRNDAVIYAELNEEELALKIVERISFGNYWRIINYEDSGNTFTGGELAPTDWTGLVSKYFQQIMFDVTVIGENTIRLDKVKWDIQGEYELPATLNEITLVEVSTSAFANQTQLTSITLPSTITSIGANAFSGCTSLTSVNIPASVKSIGVGAFKGCTNLNISVASYNSHYSAQGNILYNKAKTAIVGSGKVDSNVVVPSTVTTILTSAFEDNHNLDTITFNNAPSIGDYAFKNCSELSYVYFNTNTAPTLGVGAFSNTNFIVYVPYDYTSQFNTVFNGIATSVTSKSSAVTFVCDGATVAPITIHYGETIHNLPTPSITGYTFEDWYEEENLQGKTWQNGDVWLYEENKTLYAKTTPIQYTVTLNPAEGTLVGGNQITATYDELVSTNATVSRVGSVFEGWYDENGVKYIDSDGNGVKVWDKTENTTLTAYWRTESYQIQINKDGTIVYLGENGFSTVSSSIPYGTQLNAINLVPMFKASTHGYKEGKIFDRFVRDGSTLDWNWTTIPDLGEDGTVITIIPVWVLESHTIHFNPLCNMNVASITKNYGEDIVLPSLNRTGYTFNGWTKETEPDTLVNWVKMPDLTLGTQANGSVQLVAKWTPNTYNVKYVANGGSGTMSQSVHTYDVQKALNENAFWRTHYDFMGWATTSTGEVVYKDCEDVINLTTVKNGMVTLYAVWRGERFNINYENREFQNQKADVLLDNYIGNYAPSYYEYGTGLQVSRVSAFWQSEGPYDAQLRFMGWYLDPDLTDPAVDITATDTGAVTWYAKWRYDFNYGGRYGTYTVTDANQMNQNYDQLYLGLGYDNLHQELLDIGIKNVTITFKINMWRTADQGTQYIYFYGGSDGTTLLQQYSFSVGSTKEVRRIDFVFDLQDLGAINYINVRYKASTSGWWLWEESDTWQNDETHYEVVYVTELDDKYALEFYWSYKDPFD